jgi:hypothetical protein
VKAEIKSPGNAKTQRHQQPLSSKHRWSSKDLTVATPEDLRDRVDQLQRQLEELRRAINKSSSAKSGATTGNGGQGPPNMTVGRAQSVPNLPSSQHSAKNCAFIPIGKNVAHARSADHVQRAGLVGATQQRSQGGNSTPDPSTATAAVLSKQIGIPQRVIRTAETIPAGANAPTQAAPLAKPRNLPRYKGVSFASTVKSGPVESNDKPILATVAEAVKSHDKLSLSKKRALRLDDKRFVDEELVYYLRMEFAFKPRDSSSFGQMHTCLRKHLRTYDTRHFTQKEMYDISVEVVNTAMAISPQEQAVRAGWKDENALEEVRKNNKFIMEGKVGNTAGVFGKTMHTIDARPK